MFGAAATTDASELFWIVVLMIAGGWVLARSRRLWWAPPSGSRPSYPSESPSVLEMRAEGFEKTGDFDGAMEALLASHFAGSSQAVKLAHELSKRHPGAFQSKGCPVRLGVGSTPTPKQAGANTALASSVVSGGDGGGGCTAAPSEPLTAPSSVGHSAEQSGELASDVGPARAGEPTIAVAAPIAAAASDGQTPWERGWYGPVGFKPPPSDGAPPAAAVPAAAAAYDSISPTSENAPTSMKRGGTSGRRGRSGGSGNDIRVVWGGNSSSNATTAGLRNFTVAQLNGFDGGVPVPISRGGLVRSGKARPVYIALKGKVYDASSGNDLYGPGGKYTEFAGHDISRRVARGLAGGSSGNDGSAELDDLALDGLDRFEQMTLTGWEDMFAARGYPVLGRVVAPPPPRTFSRAELRSFNGRRLAAEEERGGEGGGKGRGRGGGGGGGEGGRGGGVEGGRGRGGGGEEVGEGGGREGNGEAEERRGGGGGAEEGAEGGRRGLGGDSLQYMPPGYATPPIYLGVKDKVFDVSFGGSEFYLEGGAYECLAGRDASRVLAKMSMTPEDIEGVLDYQNLTDRESKNLTDWVEKLGESGRGYPVVGWIDLDVSE